MVPLNGQRVVLSPADKGRTVTVTVGTVVEVDLGPSPGGRGYYVADQDAYGGQTVLQGKSYMGQLDHSSASIFEAMQPGTATLQATVPDVVDRSAPQAMLDQEGVNYFQATVVVP